MGSVAAEIERRLSAVRVSGTGNELSASELRAGAVEYLSDYSKELARFPQLAENPHWNLWMIDKELENALFAILVFRLDGVEFTCGTGESFAIREWSDNTMCVPTELIAEANRYFKVGEESLHLSCEAAKDWLGCSW